MTPNEKTLPKEKISIFHKIAHLLGNYHGYCDAFYKGKKLYMSYVCSTCGKRSMIFPIDNVIDRDINKEMKRRKSL